MCKASSITEELNHMDDVASLSQKLVSLILAERGWGRLAPVSSDYIFFS